MRFNEWKWEKGKTLSKYFHSRLICQVQWHLERGGRVGEAYSQLTWLTVGKFCFAFSHRFSCATLIVYSSLQFFPFSLIVFPLLSPLLPLPKSQIRVSLLTHWRDTDTAKDTDTAWDTDTDTVSVRYASQSSGHSLPFALWVQVQPATGSPLWPPAPSPLPTTIYASACAAAKQKKSFNFSTHCAA